MTQTQTTPTPTTDEEYAIQALTIHGTFFERKCQDVVRKAKDWTIHETNYPVEYNGAASNLDIWAERVYSASRLILPIECKKHNADFIDWIFFPKATHRPSSLHIRTIEIQHQSGQAGNWPINEQFLPLVHDLIVADEARETKGNYLLIKQRQDRTKTSNAAITEAATQIAIATKTLVLQETQVISKLSGFNGDNNIRGVPPYFNLLFFPTIVTTANLFTCEFQEVDIDLATGVIPFNKANLIRRPYLIFDYPVPVALQDPPLFTGTRYENFREAFKLVSRMPIFVVQSASFSTFLARLQLPRYHQAPFAGEEPWYEIKLEPHNI